MSLIDLHVHSPASDGTLSPAAVVEEAAAAGLSAIALTDHDTVDGVGEADVMITVKSSEEKVFRVDRSVSDSSTEETDSAGGSRRVSSGSQEENTVLTGSGGGEFPIVEKELMPEIEGVAVSADGGGDARIQAEISAALEALFHVPQHKIRVLKRVE